jgi:hypothetical protein
VFTRALHWSLSLARSIQSIPVNLISLTSILILYHTYILVFLVISFLLVFPRKSYMHSSSASCVLHGCPSHLPKPVTQVIDGCYDNVLYLYSRDTRFESRPTYHWAGWFAGNAVGLCSGGARFASRAGHRLYWLFHGFPQCLHANSRLMPRLRSRQLPSKSVPIHRSSVILYSMLCSLLIDTAVK